MTKNPLFLFILLQALDFGTTSVAMAMGGTENNPLIGHLMSLAPLNGLLLSKLIAIAIAGMGAVMHKHRGIRLANLAFMGVVAWNIAIIGRLAISAL